MLMKATLCYALTFWDKDIEFQNIQEYVLLEQNVSARLASASIFGAFNHGMVLQKDKPLSLILKNVTWSHVHMCIYMYLYYICVFILYTYTHVCIFSLYIEKTEKSFPIHTHFEFKCMLRIPTNYSMEALLQRTVILSINTLNLKNWTHTLHLI